jgi:hypothetical protein
MIKHTVVLGLSAILLCSTMGLTALSIQTKQSCKRWKGVITKGVEIPVILKNVRIVTLPKTVAGQWAFLNPSSQNVEFMIESDYTTDYIIFNYRSNYFPDGTYTMKFLSGDNNQHIVTVCTK